jgi:hypothetical protein
MKRITITIDDETDMQCGPRLAIIPVGGASHHGYDDHAEEEDNFESLVPKEDSIPHNAEEEWDEDELETEEESDDPDSETFAKNMVSIAKHHG